MLPITRYAIKSTPLRPWVEFIWHFQLEHTDINHKLLPTDSIDIIINLADPITYESDGLPISPSPIHINGLRSRHSFIRQSGHVHIYGIALQSYGLYPLIHKPFTVIRDRIVDMSALSATLAAGLYHAAAAPDQTPQDIVLALENVLCAELAVDDDYLAKSRLIDDFINADDSVTVRSFCEERNINIKTFERLTRRCTAYTPKVLRRLNRFQAVSNQLVHQSSERLTDLTYNHNYTDQAYFTNDFRRFTGSPPQTFRREKQSIKENTTYRYL